MLKVGLTGGMGSGKTLIAGIFSTFGIPVFDADKETKALYDADESLREALKRLLGNEIYSGHVLQRQVMANKIFADKELLHKVNSLVHPAVKNAFNTWAGQQKAPYVVQEAAILLEAGFADCVDKIITVSAPETVRMKRVAERSGLSENEIKQRMQQQWPDERRNAAADFVIVNDGWQAVLPQILKIHQQLSAL